ncbi:hypothetical protein TcBrA4_0092640 [Trypanosoma cruzi]|nr:hypothetical protein TcBrA4_0092640 [Trypanosoma cruzi]
MATPKQAAKKASKKHGGGRSAKAGLTFPVGRVGSLLRAASMPAASARRALCTWRGAGVPDSRAAGAVREGGEPAGKEAEAPDAPHGDACRAPRRRLGMLLKNVTLSRGGVIPSLNKAVAKKHKSSRRRGRRPGLERPSGQAQGRGAPMLDAPGWPCR